MASWNFVLWGVVHGMLLVGHRLFRAVVAGFPRVEAVLHSHLGHALCVALTFCTVCCTWVPFREASLTKMAAIFERMVIPSPGMNSPATPASLLYIALIVVLCHLVGSWPKLLRRLDGLPGPVISTGYCTALMFALVLAPKSGQAFIYFQF